MAVSAVCRAVLWGEKYKRWQGTGCNEVFGTPDNQAGGLPCLIFAVVDVSQR